jgi:hypothetical protein
MSFQMGENRQNFVAPLNTTKSLASRVVITNSRKLKSTTLGGMIFMPFFMKMNWFRS